MTWTRLALSCALFVAGCSQTAAPTPAVKAEARQHADGICALTGSLAESTMRARQSGVPLSTILAASGTGMTRQLALQAYEWPAYFSEAGKRRAALDFRNEAETACQARIGA